MLVVVKSHNATRKQLGNTAPPNLSVPLAVRFKKPKNRGTDELSAQTTKQ